MPPGAPEESATTPVKQLLFNIARLRHELGRDPYLVEVELMLYSAGYRSLGIIKRIILAALYEGLIYVKGLDVCLNEYHERPGRKADPYRYCLKRLLDAPVVVTEDGWGVMCQKLKRVKGAIEWGSPYERCKELE